jgi:predicted Zn-dependent protease with MMP-like domain
MQASDFEQLVVEALESLPAEFQHYLDDIDILVERRPNRYHRRALDLRPWQSIYGLYEGIPRTERVSDMFAAPDTITIFQEPLERDFRTAAQLREQVQRTVLHELAHHFGISDERLRELGAY